MFSRFHSKRLLLLAVAGLTALSGAPSGADAAPQTPKASPAPRVAKPVQNAPGFPPLGGGLNGQSNYGKDYAYADAIDNAGAFFRLNPFGGLDLSSRSPVDANNDCSENSFGHYIFEAFPVAGTYKLRFQCDQQPTVGTQLANATVTNVQYNATTKRYSADLVVAPGNGVLILTYQNTGGTLRDLSLYRPGVDPQNPPLFNPNYLNFLRTRRPANLRFMDIRVTNANFETNWSERNLPVSLRQNKDLTKTIRVEGGNPNGLGQDIQQSFDAGAAFEYCVALCNELGTDMWMTLPVNATDDYVTNAARVIRDGSTLTIPGTNVVKTYAGLRPDLRIHVEFSNEVWNDQFRQTGFNRQAAVNEVVAANGTANPSDLNYDNRPVTLNNGFYTENVTWGDRRVARRIKQIGDIFVREFRPAGTPVTDRSAFGTKIRPVLAYQLVPARFRNQLSYLNDVYGKPDSYLWGIGVAPYFASGNGNGADARTNLTPSMVLDQFEEDIDHLRTGGTLNEVQTVASFYGLKVAGYEGGPDTFGGNNIAAKKTASLDPRMKKVVINYLDTWYGKGNDLFNWFVLGAGDYDTQFGTWSISTDLADLNQPKAQGYDAVRDAPLPPIAIGAVPPVVLDARRENDNGFLDDFGRASSFYRRFIGTGSTFDYLINAPATGNYSVVVNVGDAQDAPLQIIANNGAVQTVNVAAGSTFTDAPTATVALNAGLNTIRLRVPTNRPYDINTVSVFESGTAPALNGLPLSSFYEFFPDRAPGTVYTQDFTVGDDNTAPEAITVTASTDNAQLLPSVVVSSTGGANRRLTLTPAGIKSGRAIVRVSYTDSAGAVRAHAFRIKYRAQSGDSPNFSLTPGTAPSLAPGGTANLPVTVNSLANCASMVELSVTGLPTGVRGLFVPATVPVGGTSTLRLSAEPGSPVVANAPLVISASGVLVNSGGGESTVTRTANAAVSVGAPAPPTVLSFTVTRSGLVLNRATNTFNGTLTLRYTGATPLSGGLAVVV
ncbi:MAG: hypothetical protein H7Y38_18955, partial [Armatimonadetes bacterium]|nr:hypothetical protein [Armatimonadota bacterium]